MDKDITYLFNILIKSMDFLWKNVNTHIRIKFRISLRKFMKSLKVLTELRFFKNIFY